MSRVIISGGRYMNSARLLLWAIELAAPLQITTVLSGACFVRSMRWWELAHGADGLAELWALHNGIPCERYYADRYGDWPGCGPKRNLAMAQNAQALIALPGGRGTNNMVETAHRLGLSVYDARALKTGG